MIEYLLILGFCMAVHECGHFCFAKAFGVLVYSFQVFMAPIAALVRYYPKQGCLCILDAEAAPDDNNDSEDGDGDAEGNNVVPAEPRSSCLIRIPLPRPKGEVAPTSWRNTRFGLGWLPVMAYVRMADSYGVDGHEPLPWELRSKPAWQRLLVHSGGVMANVLFGLLAFVVANYVWMYNADSTYLLAAIGGGLTQCWDALSFFLAHPLAIFGVGSGFEAAPLIVSKMHGIVYFTGLLSIILAVGNALPIPGLDGSRICLNLAEIVTRRAPSERLRRNIDIAGGLLVFLWIVYLVLSWIA